MIMSATPSLAAKTPRVGVGVFIIDSRNKFLLGLRKGSHGAGNYPWLPYLYFTRSLHPSFTSIAHGVDTRVSNFVHAHAC